MKRLYESPILELSEFEVEDIIMESKSLGQASLEAMQEAEVQEVMAALKNSYTIKRNGTDFTGW